MKGRASECAAFVILRTMFFELFAAHANAPILIDL
jgi:hypothetical protein